ncbi:hypothetical protein WJX81_002535 [Elliptochloris bilobata]|uniref:RRM domain-containing protein n=1 Tax=Elliptochloris bilobata TaxID=381761 RepID=A0AAW1SLD7_9CHLO
MDAQLSVDAEMGAKLSMLLQAINGRFWQSLALAQVWSSTSDSDALPSSGAKKGQQKTVLSTDALPCAINDTGLQQFRVRSCEQGISSAGLGMLGKVWSTGALQVVQNVAIIPQSVHPRNKLDSSLARLVSELIYIPIYDVALPKDGVQAVLELVVAADAQENQIVGNVISYVSNILDELQLSLAKPEEPAELPDFEMAPRSPPQSAAPPHMNIGYVLTEEQLHAYFSRFGTVLDVYLPRHKSGRNKGFGFTTFATEEELDCVLQESEHMVDGIRALSSSHWTPDALPDASHALADDPNHGGGPAHVHDGPETSPFDSSLAGSGGGGGGAVGHGRGPRLYVGGVPDDVQDEDIVAHFRRWGNVLDIYFPGKKGFKRVNYCFVTFDNWRAAQRACTHSERAIGGRPIQAISIAEERGSGSYGGGSSLASSPLAAAAASADAAAGLPHGYSLTSSARNPGGFAGALSFTGDGGSGRRDVLGGETSYMQALRCLAADQAQALLAQGISGPTLSELQRLPCRRPVGFTTSAWTGDPADSAKMTLCMPGSEL